MGGAVLSSVAVPDGTADYEVRATLTIAQNGGSFIVYLRATTGSLLQGGNPGTYFAVDLSSPNCSGTNCSALLYLFQSVAGSISYWGGSAVPCHNGSVLRAMIRGNTIAVYIDDVLYGLYDASAISTGGHPGVGMVGPPTANGIARVELGPADRTAPTAVNAGTVQTSSFPNHVDLHWTASSDDANGVGIAYYDVYRNGVWVNHTISPQFTDTAVSASTSYTYWIVPVDFHLNSVLTAVPVSTPAAGSVDPRVVGVRPTGTYWGGAGEQIDLRSGNVNYTIPLLKAMGRGGWSVPFGLSYNSQNWRQDPGGTWQLGQDTGYGFGWKLQAGSLTPVYQDYYTIHHYVFSDASGAEYRLDQNSGGVWSSKESIYVYYDANTQRLNFRDGSFWAMGAMSGGTEADAGTQYPTLMEDTNGNQIAVRYYNGAGLLNANSSARIRQIEDVRAFGGPPSHTYDFNFSTDSTPALDEHYQRDRDG